MIVIRPQLAVALAGLLVAAPALRADVLTVGPAGDFATIQAALDASLPGDTVLVAGGQYGAVTVDGRRPYDRIVGFKAGNELHRRFANNRAV